MGGCTDSTTIINYGYVAWYANCDKFSKMLEASLVAETEVIKGCCLAWMSIVGKVDYLLLV
jgi:hypothetical protein